MFQKDALAVESNRLFITYSYIMYCVDEIIPWSSKSGIPKL